MEHDGYSSRIYKENWDDAIKLLNDLDQKYSKLSHDNQRLKLALDALVCVIGLTAIKYEHQKQVLQEAIDLAENVLHDR